MQAASKFIFFLALAGATTQCTTTINIPTIESAPENLFRVIGGYRNLHLGFKKQTFYETEPFYKDIEENINQLRYYRSISRYDAEKKAPMDENVAGPGERAAANLILLIDIPKNGEHTCQKYSYVVFEQRCVKWGKNSSGQHTCLKEEQVPVTYYVAADYFTLYLNSNLLSVETSRTIAFTSASQIQTHVRTSRQIPIDCVGYAASFVVARNHVSRALAAKYSPVVRDYSVPLFKDGDGVNEGKKKDVETLLARGITAMKENKAPELARKSWEEALQVSENRSPCAFWNLAVYYWLLREMDKALSLFDSSFEAGGPAWISSSRRKAFNRFYHDKKLIEKYNLENL